jgi:hypothetical protein
MINAMEDTLINTVRSYVLILRVLRMNPKDGFNHEHQNAQEEN